MWPTLAPPARKTKDRRRRGGIAFAINGCSFHGRSDTGTIEFRFRNFFDLLSLKSKRGQRRVDFNFSRRIATERGLVGWGTDSRHGVCLKGNVRYAIHFTDGFKMDCLTLEGAMRVIASRHRVGRGDLITDTTEEKVVVWLYSGEISIAEVFVSRVTATTMP
jgi:hypothetical protein